MKKVLSIIILLIFVIASPHLRGQTKSADSNIVHSGFGWGGTPILAFDSDLGLRYGAVINLFDYGKGDQYPNYLQYAKIKLFNSTRGTSNLSVVFDSDKFFLQTKVISEASYIKDVALNFFGFNGKNTNYLDKLTNPEHSIYENSYYYNHQRDWLRLRLDFQTRTSVDGLRVLYGATYNKVNVKAVSSDVLNIPERIDGSQPDAESLYLSYVDWNVIEEDEKSGGQISHLSLGAIYDTRDNQLNCNKGLWLESYMIYSPNLKNSSEFAKHIFTFRQYLRMPKANMIFQYRLSSQQKLFGEVPFYYLPIYYDSQMNQDGLGGAFTLRGLTRNRIATDGFLLANTELRKKVSSFRMFRLNWDIELSLFADAAQITQEYKADYNGIPSDYIRMLIKDSYDRKYISYGAGLYIIYNVNNIISVNYGMSNDDQLGVRGLYIGSAFLF